MEASAEALPMQESVDVLGPPQSFFALSNAEVAVYQVQYADVPEGLTEEKLNTVARPSGKTLHIIKSHIWPFQGVEVAALSPDGSVVALGTGESLTLAETNGNFTTLHTFQCGKVRKLFFSPKGTYVVLLLSDSVPANVKVYTVASGDVVASLGLKGLAAEEQWPCIQWSAGESLCFIQVVDALVVFPGDLHCFPKAETTIKAPRLDSFAISPVEGPLNEVKFAIYQKPETGKPGVVNCYSITDWRAGSKPEFLNRKAFFQVTNTKLFFSRDGSAVLLLVSADTDVTGKSYYSSSGLHYVTTSPGASTMQFVGLADGPVHDVQWAPDETDFVAIWGSKVNRAVCFDGRNGREKLDFGTSKRNTVAFNPEGRFILVGGFGNMAGEIDIWDKKTQKLIGAMRAPCTVITEFSPDGRLVLCASTTPRMRVDNSITIYRYNGEMLASLPFEKLYGAFWISQPEGTFRPRSPSIGRNLLKEAVADVKVYRPKGAPTSSEMKSKSKQLNCNAKTIDSGVSQTSPVSASARAGQAGPKKNKHKMKR